MRTLRLVDTTVAFYPVWWRKVYEDEIRRVVEDLVDDGRSEWRLAANLMRGAMITRLRGDAMPMQRELWAARTRASIAVATLPWLAVMPFVLAAFTGHNGYQSISAGTIAHLEQSPATTISALSYGVLQDVQLLSVLVIAFGWFDLIRGIHGPPTMRRGHLVALSYVPLMAFAVDVARLNFMGLPSSFVSWLLLKEPTPVIYLHQGPDVSQRSMAQSQFSGRTHFDWPSVIRLEPSSGWCLPARPNPYPNSH